MPIQMVNVTRFKIFNMNIKAVVALIIVTGILVGGWFGFSSWNRNRILNSGRPVLLINKSTNQFAFSDLTDREDIDRKWKIIGYYDEMTQEEINALTAGYNFVMEGGAAGDGRVPQLISADVQAPSAEERGPWAIAVQTLTTEQSNLCGQIPIPTLSQYCIVRHITFNAMVTGQGSSACDPIFIQDYRQECIEEIENNNVSRFRDVDSNNLLDAFQAYGEVNTEQLFEEFQKIPTQ